MEILLDGRLCTKGKEHIKIKKFIKSASVLYLFSNLFTQLISYITFYYLSSCLTKEEFGKFSLAETFIMFCSIITGLGFDKAMIRFNSARNSKFRLHDYINFQIIVSVCFVVLFFIVNKIYIKRIELNSLMIIGVIVGFINLYYAYLQSIRDARKFVVIKLASTLLTIILVIFIIDSKSTYIEKYYIDLFVFTLVFSTIIMFIKDSYKLEINFNKCIDIIVYSIPLILAVIVSAMLMYCGRFILAEYCSLSEVSDYSFSFKTSCVIILFGGSLLTAFNPVYFRWSMLDSRHSINKLKKLLFKNLSFIYIVYFIILLIVFNYSDLILPIKYEGIEGSIIILTSSNTISILSSFTCVPCILSFNKTIYNLYFAFIGFIAFIVICFVFVNEYKSHSIVIANYSANNIIFICQFFFVKYKLKYRYSKITFIFYLLINIPCLVYLLF